MRHLELVTDLRAERQSLVDVVAGADLATQTPAAGWSIQDTISHLWQTDEAALAALATPEIFANQILANAFSDPDGFVDAAVADRRGLSRDVVMTGWSETFEELIAELTNADLEAKIAWFGPPMNPTSFGTARLMEYWSHGQDVADALGVTREPTARLRHICHLGVRTRQFSYALRNLPLPDVEVGVELTLPDGSTYDALPQAAERITGTAEDFCLVVTQRRHPDDTALQADGSAAKEWLRIAQCFAGPPGKGREAS